MMSAGAGQILLAAALWGTTGTTMALAPAGAEPLGTGALRLLLGGSVLALVAWARGDFQQVGHLPLRLLAGAGLMVAAYQVCFFFGVARNGVAPGTLLTAGSAPMLAGVLEWHLFRKRPDRRWFLATALALVGCILLLLPATNPGHNLDAPGMLLSLGAGLAWALYALASKRLLVELPPNAVVAAIFLPGALFLLPVLLLVDTGWVLQPAGLLVILHLGLVTTALAYLLFARGLRMVSAATAVTLVLAEPLVASLLAVFLLGERYGGRNLAGLLALAAGLVLLSLPAAASRKASHGPPVS